MGAPVSLEHAPLAFSSHMATAAAWAGRWLSSLGSSGSQPWLSVRITEGLFLCQGMAQWPGVKLATRIL